MNAATTVSSDVVRVVTPAPRRTWETLLAADPHALVSQTPRWVDAMRGFGYEDVSRLYELGSGRTIVLPLVRRRHRPAALVGQASLPANWGIGGIVGPDEVTAEDAAAVFGDLRRRPGIRTILRPSPLQAPAWERARPPGVVVIPRLGHVLDLDGGFEEVWDRRFTGAARTAVRKAQRSELRVELDTAGRLVPAFYQLFEKSLDRWARQQHEPLLLSRVRGHRRDPRRKLELLAAAMGEQLRIWVAWLGSDPVAAILVLQGANAHYTLGAMDKALAGPVRANYLLHRHAIEDACRAGCRHYHLGETGSSASLAQFKTRFGAAAHRYAEYRLERFPVTAIDRRMRGAVKRIIRFRDP